MRRSMLALAVLMSVVPLAATAQLANDELQSRIQAAGADEADLPTIYQGAAAARLLGDHESAADLLDEFEQAVVGATNALVGERIMQAMASGQGANGMIRVLREARETFNLSPIRVAALANNFPTLLTGGELDAMILRMRADHPNPNFRCACLAQKAWVHRVAGNQEEAQKLWAELATARDENPPPADNAQAQGQYARDLARAGRMDEARRVLEAAMAMDVSDAQRPGVQRRWAQAYAELGDVEGAVALLEPLLETSTLVTVESLSTRYTWEPIRHHAAFQAMLARHH